VEWEEFINSFWPIVLLIASIASIAFSAWMGYKYGKKAWLDTRRMENAKERLTNILIDMEVDASDTERRIRAFEENPYDDNESFFGLNRRLEHYSKFPIFGQIKIQYRELYSQITGFFRSFGEMVQFRTQARRDIGKCVEDMLDVIVPQETIVTDPEYGDYKVAAAEKRNALGPLVTLLYPAIVMNWSAEKTLKKLEEKRSWRGEFARFSPLTIERSDFVHLLYMKLDMYDSIGKYAAARKSILDSYESLMTSLSERIQEDTKLAFPE
jgi:hypothetical protein